MIQLIIKSGLGNQMFQYAYARTLQEEYRRHGIEHTLEINPYFIDHRKIAENDERKMSLQHFALNPNVIITPRIEQKSYLDKFKLTTLLSVNPLELFKWRLLKQKPLGKKAFDRRAKHGIYYTFTAYTDYGFPLSNRQNQFVFGFFQTDRGFKLIADIIKREFIVKDKPSVANQEMISKINSSNSVCLHIRRGDYLNPAWANLQVCDFKYYNDSINYILDRVDNPVFFVFSNSHKDIEWIKENYHFKDNNGDREIRIIYVDLDNPDYEELRLMYICKHFIISNSTFSWWGAYLSSYESKIVLTPERWNLSDPNDYLIYPQDWIKMEYK